MTIYINCYNSYSSSKQKKVIIFFFSFYVKLKTCRGNTFTTRGAKNASDVGGVTKIRLGQVVKVFRDNNATRMRFSVLSSPVIFLAFPFLAPSSIACMNTRTRTLALRSPSNGVFELYTTRSRTRRMTF